MIRTLYSSCLSLPHKVFLQLCFKFKQFSPVKFRQIPREDLRIHGQIRPVLVGGPGGGGNGRLERSFIAGHLTGAGPRYS